MADANLTRSVAYDRIDRILRLNLGDADYATFSQYLEQVYTAAPSSEEATDAQRWRWIRRNAVRMEDYAFSIDEDVEAYVDTMIAQGLEDAGRDL